MYGKTAPLWTSFLPSCLPGPLCQDEAAVEGLDKVKRNIMNVLVTEPDGRVALQDLESAYQQCNNLALDFSWLQGVTSTAELVQCCKPELEVGQREWR